MASAPASGYPTCSPLLANGRSRRARVLLGATALSTRTSSIRGSWQTAVIMNGYGVPSWPGIGGDVVIKLMMVSAILPVTVGLGMAAPAHADGGWVAAASSPSHEQMDFAWGADQVAAESRALSQCAALQRASDCVLLASGPDCLAVAWDVDEPINHAHGVSGGGRDVVVQAAVAAAGPYANDVASRCSWDPHL